MSLEQAPDEVKLAVDLIMLLENHDIAPHCSFIAWRNRSSSSSACN
ncbi:hypothetical protein BN133_4042 [Cronobacter dublinensis 582]|nr:hypothetical protein BN133_4042 [Cronobacter dublinensis 582]